VKGRGKKRNAEPYIERVREILMEQKIKEKRGCAVSSWLMVSKREQRIK